MSMQTVAPNYPAPDRSLAQRQQALAKANEIRTKRAQLKRDISAGRKSARDIIAEPPEWAETMKVIDLLMAVRGIGRVKAVKTLGGLGGVSPSKTLGGVTDRQRQALIWALSTRAQQRDMSTDLLRIR